MLPPANEWKSKRYWVCKSGMALWVGLQLCGIRVRREPTRAERKKAARSYPGDTNGCRCKDCRYHRLAGRLR